MRKYHRTNKLREKNKKNTLVRLANQSMGGQTTVAAIYKRTVRRHMGEKLAWLFILAVLALLILGAVYFKLTTQDYSEYAVKVLNNYSYASEELEAPRGAITDRNGTSLAYSQTYYLLILEPKTLMDKECYDITLDALSKTLGIQRSRIEEVLDSTDSNGVSISEKGYYRFREEDGTTLLHITEDQATAFNDLKASVNVGNSNKKSAAIKKMYDFDDEEWKQYKQANENYTSYQIQGAYFEKQFDRVYPYSQLASKIIGYYSDGASTGIENYYSDYLTGIAGKSYSYLNGDYNVSTQIVDEIAGNTVVSTIDLNIQKMVEESIANYLKEWNAENVAVIVMNPNNGEILAMADDKSYDLNNPVSYPEGVTAEDFAKLDEDEQKEMLEEMYSVQRFYCTTSPYEPGSIFKPITVASALEEGTAKVDDVFDCYGALHVRGYNIRCHNREGCGELTLTGSLENSCNVSLMQIAFDLGAEKFDTYFKRFGFGSKVGIDLPGEEGCGAVVFKDYTKETELELATSSFGQGFAVTMVQMAGAFSSLVNGGYYYTPHVVKEIMSSDGALVETYDTTAKRTTISNLTSEYMREALYSVIENGTGLFTRIEGYDIGGKTGTAEMSPRGNDQWVASFISAAPIENPQLLVYVVVDRTDDPEWYASSKPAQDICKEIWGKILPYYNVHSNLTEYDYLIPETTTETALDINEGSFIEEVTEESSEEEIESSTEDEADESEGESTEEGETTEAEVTDDESSSSETAEESSSETNESESPEETPIEETDEEGENSSEEIYPVAIEGYFTGTFYDGYVYNGNDIVVTVTMSDGSLLVNPDGFGAYPLTLHSGVNDIIIAYGNVTTTIQVTVE